MKKTTLKQARRAVSRNLRPVGPAVDLLEPEVRSDVVLPLTSSAGLVGELLKSGGLVGVFVVEWGYDAAEDNMDSFHSWLSKNEGKLAKSVPKGTTYRGTYVAAYGPAYPKSGRYRTFWTFRSLDDIQHFGENGTDVFKKLRHELLGFRDRSSGTGFSQIYQVAAGTPLY